MYEAAVETRHISRTNSFVYDDEDCNNQHQIVSDLRGAAQECLADQKKEEGNQLYLAKNYREALQRYNEAISLCPGCPAFYGNRAACHMMLGQFVQALEDARTSVKLDPSFVKGYVRVAKCCVALGEIHAARQAINTAISVNKEDQIAFDLERTSWTF